MPGPSFAPILGAIGVFFLGFGLVAGGLWTLVGAVILAITLLYWGREALRDYDTAAAHDGGAAVIVGALQAPAGSPPEGVHIPAPSFRPLLVAGAMTILVLGLVLGGWALILGFIAIVVTTLGWLWDATKEYRGDRARRRHRPPRRGRQPAVAQGDVRGARRHRRRGARAVLEHPAELRRRRGAERWPRGERARGRWRPRRPAPTPPIAADAVLTAKGTQFVEKTSRCPPASRSSSPSTTRTRCPHNIELKDASGAKVFEGEIVTGPAVVDLRCARHPCRASTPSSARSTRT